MKTRVLSRVVLFLFVFALAMPLWAKTMKATIDIDPAVIAGTHLKSGTYDFIAKQNNQLIVKKDEDGKRMAEVHGSWMTSKTKPESDEVVLLKDHIKEIHFANKVKYFVVK